MGLLPLTARTQAHSGGPTVYRRHSLRHRYTCCCYSPPSLSSSPDKCRGSRCLPFFFPLTFDSILPAHTIQHPFPPLVDAHRFFPPTHALALSAMKKKEAHDCFLGNYMVYVVPPSCSRTPSSPYPLITAEDGAPTRVWPGISPSHTVGMSKSLWRRRTMYVSIPFAVPKREVVDGLWGLLCTLFNVSPSSFFFTPIRCARAGSRGHPGTYI